MIFNQINIKLTMVNFLTTKLHLVLIIQFQKVRKPKGVDGLIEVNNPNRNRKANKKVTELDSNTEVTLSRREREEIEKQQAQQRYQKLQAEGKTEQAQRDLARLAIIRKQREEAAKKKEDVKKGEENLANFLLENLRGMSGLESGNTVHKMTSVA